MSERLTDDEWGALFRVWIENDVNRGIEWLTPTVEDILAARVQAAKADAWDEGYDEHEAPHFIDRRNPYRETETP